MAPGKVDRCGQEPGLDCARRAGGVPLPVVARFALDRLRASRLDQQQRDLPVRHESRQAASGHERLSERHAAGLRSRRQVSLSTRPIARSIRSTARSTTRGPTRTRRRLSPCRCARTSSRRSPRATTRRPRRSTPTSRTRRSRRQGRRQTGREAAAPANVDIDLDRLRGARRGAAAEIGLYADLQAVKGKLLYRRAPRAGSTRRRARSCSSISRNGKKRRFSTTPRASR